MKTVALPSSEILHELLNYDPETGMFTWKTFRSNLAKAGDIADNLMPDGYVSLCINNRQYRAHRIAYKMVHGHDPKGVMDHIDGNRANNKISNLRVASLSQNQWNSSRPQNNTSKLKGVTWKKDSKKWAAQIQVDGKKIWLGVYEDKNDAHQAYMKAAVEHFGEFANSGEGL